MFVELVVGVCCMEEVELILGEVLYGCSDGFYCVRLCSMGNVDKKGRVQGGGVGSDYVGFEGGVFVI